MVASILDWVTTEGFAMYFDRMHWPWATATAFRQRDIIAAAAAGRGF